MRVGLRLLVGAMLVNLLVPSAQATEWMLEPRAACRWWQHSSVDSTPMPLVTVLEDSPTRHRQLPLFRELMQQPLTAPCRASGLLDDARRIESPTGLLAWIASLAGIFIETRPTGSATSSATPNSADPLAAAIDWIRPLAEAQGGPWPPRLPDPGALPDPLRTEIAALFSSMGRAYGQLARALARLPSELTVDALRRQIAVVSGPEPNATPDLGRLVRMVDRKAVLDGMLDLAEATERLQRFVAAASTLPPIAWQADTPLGPIVVDTTGRDNRHRLASPLFVLDVGGDDVYEFIVPPPARHMAVLLDHGGNDHYVAKADGADASVGVLGYGILWDAAGDDLYEGAHLAQGSALFGAALLVDPVGRNRFVAAGQAQGWALGGVALLLTGPGEDEFLARTHAQASAGPEGIAALIDRGGNDRYTLGNEPLSMPSPQLPDRNTSMGQGAGRGFRPRDGLSATGGIGLLIDIAGNDRYLAQVFAQGAGFYEGAGLLIDGGGADRFDAAWYAMGAAAHTAVGVLLKRGSGVDRYRATHSASLGAAHDLSVGVFLDEGGDDFYALGDLGFGAVHDGGVALFADLAGRDRYEVGVGACRAFGVVQSSEPGSPADGASTRGLFIDLEQAGDELPSHCQRLGEYGRRIGEPGPIR
jgi:hypothetical protein